MLLLIEKKLNIKEKIIKLISEKKDEAYLVTLLEKYVSILNEGKKSVLIVENLLRDLRYFSWVKEVDLLVKNIENIIQENRCSYLTANFLYSNFNSINEQNDFNKNAKEQLVDLLENHSEVSVREKLKYDENFNFLGKIYPQFLLIIKESYASDNENPTLADSVVSHPIVPMMESKNGNVVFYLSGEHFIYNHGAETIKKLNGVPQNTNYLQLIEAQKFFKISKKEAKYNSPDGKITMKIFYEDGTPKISINEKVYEVREDNNVRDIILFSLSGNTSINEYIINTGIFLVENLHRFVELDFAQKIVNKINENKETIIFKLANKAHVINYDTFTLERYYNEYSDINECVQNVLAWTGYNVYESLDNLLGHEETDNTLLIESKKKLVENLNTMLVSKQKINNESHLLESNEELQKALEIIETKIESIKNGIKKINEELGITNSSLDPELYTDGLMLGRYREIPAGLKLKVNEDIYNTAYSENPIKVWIGENQFFIPKKYIKLIK